MKIKFENNNDRSSCSREKYKFHSTVKISRTMKLSRHQNLEYPRLPFLNGLS